MTAAVSVRESPVFPRGPDERRAIRLTAETIVRLGAVMVTPHPSLQCHVLAHIAWLGDRHLFWFDAIGVTEAAGHRLEYDECCRVGHRGVVFFRRGEIVGYICTLASAGTRDVELLRTAHQLWTMLAPREQSRVCACCERLHQFGGPRSCTWRLARCASTRELSAASTL